MKRVITNTTNKTKTHGKYMKHTKNKNKQKLKIQKQKNLK